MNEGEKSTGKLLNTSELKVSCLAISQKDSEVTVNEPQVWQESFIYLYFVFAILGLYNLT